MSGGRPLFLGEGEGDVGRIVEGEKRRPPCDFEGDLPRLVRRLSEHGGGPAVFGYDADTLRGVVARIARGGRPMRLGGKAKDLRDAVLAAVADYAVVVALIDARAGEVDALKRDVEEILRQCRERTPGARVAIGLAIQEVEIWMLADPQSRTAAFGEGEHRVPDDLEAEGDPKALWRTLAGKGSPPPAGVSADLHADAQRCKAWESLRPDVTAHACPRGFAPFAARVREALHVPVEL